MRFRIKQECGQKWYRRRSWRRPFWRKLRTKVIEKGELVDMAHTRAGVYANFKVTEYKYINHGVAFGPIMFFWRY